jgi:hypothetical protein
MSVLSASTAIQDRFTSLWGATTPYQFPNENYDPPAPDPSAPTTSAWARLAINDGAGEQPYLATPKEFQMGVVTISVFVPTGINIGYATQLAVQAKAIFNRVKVGALTFRTSWVKQVGESADKHGAIWYQVNAVCPYWREE